MNAWVALVGAGATRDHEVPRGLGALWREGQPWVSRPGCVVSVSTEHGGGIRHSRCGRFLLVGQGRLDRRSELQQQLAATASADDLDLLLLACERWGNSAPERLYGDFSFLCWDCDRQAAFLARDAFGVSDLAYVRTDSGWLFASDTESLLDHGAVSRQPDLLALCDYLCATLPEPGRTFHRALRRVPAGHGLELCLDRLPSSALQPRPWWQPNSSAPRALNNEADAAEAVLEALRRAVADRLPSNRGAAVLTSGGLDSPAVAALAAEHLASQNDRPVGEQLWLGSLVFPTLAECDEGDYVSELERALGLRALRVSAEEHIATREQLHSARELPAVGWEETFSPLLDGLYTRGARVLLTGLGGDELFGGSPLVYMDALLRGRADVFLTVTRHARRQGKATWPYVYCYFLEPLLPAVLARHLRRVTGRENGAKVPPWLSRGLRRQAHQRLDRASNRGRSAREQILDRLRNPEAWLPAVARVGRQVAAAGLQARHPFLDRGLAELVAQLPPSMLFRLGQYKPLLRHALKGVVPEAIRGRRDKTRLDGYVILCLTRLASGLRGQLAGGVLEQLGIVDGRRLESELEHFLSRPRSGSVATALWLTVTLELWLQARSAHRCVADLGAMTSRFGPASAT